MKLVLNFLAVLVGCMSLVAIASKNLAFTPCWCWPGDWHILSKPKPHTPGNEYTPYGSYGTEADWNNPQRILSLNYEQAEGKRVFYRQCVWCHADSTPAGPSNRSNISPVPPLFNDGTILNGESDASLHRVIAQGGRAVNKSAMMPPYGASLTEGEIDNLVEYMRVIAVPEYHKPTGRVNQIWRRNP
jgi:cytochrome c oxidase cbb3-type subunit 3